MGNILSVDMSNGASPEARLLPIINPLVGVRLSNSSGHSLSRYAGVSVKVFPGVEASFRIDSNGEWFAEGTVAAKDNGMSGTATLTGKGISVQGVSGKISNIESGPVNLSVGAGINFEQGEWFAEGTVAAKDNGISGTATLTGKGISVQGVSGKISNIEIGPVNLSVGAGINFEQGRWHVEGEGGTEIYRTAGGTAENQASVEEVSGESSTQMSDGNLSKKRKRNTETLEDQLPQEETTSIKRCRPA